MAHSKPIVLVVEDEALVRMAIVDRLEEEGFLVLEAANADEALRILVNNLDVRLVFTDVDMPGTMNGIKLAAAVRDRWPPIKIVVTSGYKHVKLDEIPAQAEFVPKPYNADRLINAFRRLTD
ncbi:response regulator [Devosia rhizoryzae]|uniref:Response regulator n=1 Tax=Devosia rhizoryzae TaxID=2774137 RepID=A0ABX7C5X4_9HYPH|nr:response regulator [Devosia rhizoryzae]QQR39616.1 response regulator [Devosia rhizoryzae]